MSILSSRKSMCKGPEIGTIFELFLKQQSYGEKNINSLREREAGPPTDAEMRDHMVLRGRKVKFLVPCGLNELSFPLFRCL